MYLVSNNPASSSPQQKTVWDGNRATPVHLIPLKDEYDQPVIPTESYPLPFSSRTTCEPCHDYKVIEQGLHFSAGESGSSGRPGEPWVLVDEKTGTLLPLSYRNWKGMWNPQDLGLTAWDFTLLFGRHLAGGGAAEPDDKEFTPESRWEVSGRIEINCLGCHNTSNLQSPSEWAKQVLRQNFRWAATAAAGLGEVGGMASRIGGTWDIFDGPNPDDTEWAVPPFVRYDRSFFDSRHRAFLDILHKPSDARCLACHSVTPSRKKKFEFEMDVHSAAGIVCVSCHRNDISHAMVRGYEGETADNAMLTTESFTCAGCHLGSEKAEGEEALSGRLGAPFPRHKGFPAVHFKRLACTVCHSGPWPGKELTRVRTSRANRLGIYGIARWSTDLPAILEPVTIRDQNGKLAPHRLMWPAFWAERQGDRMIPLKPEKILAVAGELLTPELRTAKILAALTAELEADQTAIFILQGKIYELNIDGGLNMSPYGGETPAEDMVWAVKKNSEILPLLPEFDPAAQEIDSDTAAWIQKILEALATLPEAPGKPALLYKNFLFEVKETYLEKSEAADRVFSRPQLAWLVEAKAQPLVPEFEQRTIAQTTGSEQTLTEEQVERVLKSLSGHNQESQPKDKRDYVYVSGGKMFELDKSGNLLASDHPAAAAVTWPLAHEVRPARQSLGINGCTDCHKFNSSFLFRKARGTGPLKTTRLQLISANSFMGLDKSYQRLFGLSFAVRPLFKVVLLISVVVVCSIFAIVFLLGLGRLSGLIEKRK